MSGAADTVKQAVSLRALCESDDIAWDARRSSDGRGDWWACCPFHGEATASFHVREPAGTGGYFKCFGCGAKGTVIDYVMARDGVDAGAAIKRLAEAAGLALEGDTAVDRAAARARAKEYEARRQRELEREMAQADRNLARAVKWWKAARPADPLLAAYLVARGVVVEALGERFGWPGGIPPSLRLHPRLGAHYPGAREPAHVGPAMLGYVGRGGDCRGVHRTWITAAGRACWPLEDGVKIPKKWFGATGRMAGQPVVLAPPAPTVVVGEGIETTLALLSHLVAAGREDIGAEAALSLGAMTGSGPVGLRRGHLPAPGTERVLLALEGRRPDPAKDAAALAAGRLPAAEQARRDMDQAADRYREAGLEVQLLPPPGGARDGRDFADLAAGVA